MSKWPFLCHNFVEFAQVVAAKKPVRAQHSGQPGCGMFIAKLIWKLYDNAD